MHDDAPPLHIVSRCPDAMRRKVEYVFDTLFMAAGIPVQHGDRPPPTGPWILYAEQKSSESPLERCIAIAHHTKAWRFLERSAEITKSHQVGDVQLISADLAATFEGRFDVPFDIVANAFFFLASWPERAHAPPTGSRSLYRHSVYSRLHVRQDIVDQYLLRLRELLTTLCQHIRAPDWSPPKWPGDHSHAIVLSHDVDFLPSGALDNIAQACKSVLRSLIRQRDARDAIKAAGAFVRNMIESGDPFGCIPRIIDLEQQRGVKSSFQVAVARRHPADVNYDVERPAIRSYLSAISAAGFDLCLHGSYRSTEKQEWYVEEVMKLARTLGTPVGSRQHYLSFDYDALFRAQERSGIQFDMSVGFPDQTGPRAGFSFPYFPYNIEEDRPYRVLEIGLTLMDVTLRGYQRLKGEAAWEVIRRELERLELMRGCLSCVWHPILFAGARDPGDEESYWRLIAHVQQHGGLATDGRTINSFWRERAKRYQSFS